MQGKVKLSTINGSKSRPLPIPSSLSLPASPSGSLHETFPKLEDRHNKLSIHTFAEKAIPENQVLSFQDSLPPKPHQPRVIPTTTTKNHTTGTHEVIQSKSLSSIQFDTYHAENHGAIKSTEKIETNRKLSRLPKSSSATSAVRITTRGKVRRKSSHELLQPVAEFESSTKTPVAAAHDATVPRISCELIVEDDVKATNNDKIIQTKLFEAKALSRKNENGANMHVFSLWARKPPTNSRAENSLTTESMDDSAMAPPKLPSRGSTSAVATNATSSASPFIPSDYMVGLPEDEEFPHENEQNTSGISRYSSRGGLAQALRQTIANVSGSNVSDTDSLGSRRRGGGLSTDLDEVEELYSRHNDLESVYSIEEEDELRSIEKNTPVRRRSYSEGEMLPFIRHFSSEDIHHGYRNRSSSPTLSEVSHEEYNNDPSTAQSLSLSQSQTPTSQTTNMIDFTDSSMRWKQGEFLGEGSFGSVYKGMNEITGELIAVKQLFLTSDSEDEVKLLRKEISVMWNLNHVNIVRYLGTTRSDKRLFILLEYVPGGSIASMLKQFGAFTESLIKRFISHVIRGTNYLHSKGIIHRDIKGANILVGVDGIAKLSDFGCSKKVIGMCTTSLEESTRVMQGSVPWMAPEVIKQTGYGYSSDIWSVGATIIEMGTGRPPWVEFTSNLAALFHVANLVEPPPIPNAFSLQCKAFVGKCLMIEAKQRASAAELMLDPFMLVV